jgi:hypothetical protein
LLPKLEMSILSIDEPKNVYLERDDFWSDRWPLAVIAREGGRSRNHKTLRDYWMPRLRGA